MSPSIESEDPAVRMRAAISFAWSLLAKKVGGGLIAINKEASLQLQFGYVLQQVLPLITFHDSEQLGLELETTAKIDDYFCEIDVVLTGTAQAKTHRIAVELKCYRTRAASGKMRGASDIFMKDVYEDLAILERYVDCGHANEGVALVMTDMERLVHPADKSAKCWRYDISHGATFGPAVLDTPIGGNEVSITLTRRYQLEWRKYGKFWFLEVQGRSQ